MESRIPAARPSRHLRPGLALAVAVAVGAVATLAAGTAVGAPRSTRPKAKAVKVGAKVAARATTTTTPSRTGAGAAPKAAAGAAPKVAAGAARKAPGAVAPSFFTSCASNEPNGTAYVEGHNCRTLNFEGVDRQYIVAIPPGLPSGAPVPVVFVLHGTSGNGGEFANRTQYGWATVAARRGIVLVYPTALRLCVPALTEEDLPGRRECDVNLGNRTTRWSSGQENLIDRDEPPNGFTGTMPPNDVNFFDAIVADLGASGIQIADPGLFVSGFSAGGCMTSTLAMERADVIDAASNVAGCGPVAGGPAPARPIPLSFRVGTNDDRLATVNTVPLPMPFDPAGMLAIINTGIVTPYATAAGVDPATYATGWMTRYTANPVVTPTARPTSTVLRMTWSTATAAGAKSVTVLITRGVGHSYVLLPGSITPGEEAWTFFATQTGLPV